MSEQATEAGAVTEEQLAEWIRARIGGTIWETDEAADALYQAFTFERRTDGLKAPCHTLGWALPAASLVGPYPRAVEAAARLCRDYVVTVIEAKNGEPK